MPVRILRPGLTTSERFNACDWFTQSLYVRLLTLVDDFGRYDANPRLLKSHAFPLSDDVTPPTIAASCDQLSAAGLVQFYEVDGKKCLQLTKWQERVRSKSRYPDPPPLTSAVNCAQMIADDSNPPSIADNCAQLPSSYALRLTPNALRLTPEEVAPLPVVGKAEKAAIDFPASLDTPEFRSAWADWERHRRESRKPITPTSRRQQLGKLDALGPVRAIAALQHSTACGYQGVFEPGNQATKPTGAMCQPHELKLKRLL